MSGGKDKARLSAQRAAAQEWNEHATGGASRLQNQGFHQDWTEHSGAMRLPAQEWTDQTALATRMQAQQATGYHGEHMDPNTWDYGHTGVPRMHQGWSEHMGQMGAARLPAQQDWNEHMGTHRLPAQDWTTAHMGASRLPAQEWSAHMGAARLPAQDWTQQMGTGQHMGIGQNMMGGQPVYAQPTQDWTDYMGRTRQGASVFQRLNVGCARSVLEEALTRLERAVARCPNSRVAAQQRAAMRHRVGF